MELSCCGTRYSGEAAFGLDSSLSDGGDGETENSSLSVVESFDDDILDGGLSGRSTDGGDGEPFEEVDIGTSTTELGVRGDEISQLILLGLLSKQKNLEIKKFSYLNAIII